MPAGDACCAPYELRARLATNCHFQKSLADSSSLQNAPPLNPSPPFSPQIAPPTRASSPESRFHPNSSPGSSTPPPRLRRAPPSRKDIGMWFGAQHGGGGAQDTCGCVAGLWDGGGRALLSRSTSFEAGAEAVYRRCRITVPARALDRHAARPRSLSPAAYSPSRGGSTSPESFRRQVRSPHLGAGVDESQFFMEDELVVVRRHSYGAGH
ncbi:hypothetical protein B0H12DRAFT_1079485 [Mycena haematopus]|nr:hypothetical protein B0H12DRAFT_1079485 [Mycena haematopus]